MRPHDLITAAASVHGVIVVQAIGDARIEILGSNLETSVDGKSAGRVNSFSLFVEKNIDGLLAVEITAPEDAHGNLASYGFFLGAAWEEEKDRPSLDLAHPWIPWSSRLGQIIDNHIEVTVDGIIFTTGHHDWKTPGKRYVADTTLFCKYLHGSASNEDLEAGATEVAAEISLREELEEKKVELEAIAAASRDLIEERQRFEEMVVEERERWIAKGAELLGLANKMVTEKWPFCRKKKVAKKIRAIVSRKDKDQYG
jgi:hypothetical protein